MLTTPADLAKRLKIELNESELVFEVIRKHWWQVAKPIASILVFVGITLSLTLLVIGSVPLSMGTLLFLVVLFVLYCGLLAYLYSEWKSYWQSALIITNERVIDCQQLTFSARRLQTFDIHEIQSCSGELSPFWGWIFNFGSISINTVGTHPVIVHAIPAPELVSDTLMHSHTMAERGRSANHRSTPANSKPNELHSPGEPPPITDLTSPEDKTVNAKHEVTLLMFHVPSEQLAAITKDLPSQKEPDIRYLQKTDYYQIETIVPTSEVSDLIKRLKSLGAEDIATEQLAMVD